MNNPFINQVQVHGATIWSIETQAGVVCVIADKLHAHLSDAIRELRGDANPVVEELAAQAAEVTDAKE